MNCWHCCYSLLPSTHTPFGQGSQTWPIGWKPTWHSLTQNVPCSNRLPNIISQCVIAFQHVADNSLGHDSTHNEPEWNLKLSLVLKDAASESYTSLGGQSATQVPLLWKFSHAYIRYLLITQSPWQLLTIHWSSCGPVQPAAHSLLQHWGFCWIFK